MLKSVLITGSSRGLGRCLVDKFLAEGWRVFAGQRHAPRQAPLPGALSPPELSPPELSAALSVIDLDVEDVASVAAAARAVSESTHGLDVLINNAAVNPQPEYEAPIGRLDFAAISRTYDVNAIGPLRVIQSFLPLLERGTRKLIVNVSSEAGSLQHSWRDRSYGYCMSKAALNMQTSILDRALKPRGFNAIAIHPGWMRTQMGGMNAELDPVDSARGMFDVISGAGASTPRFVQHDGKPFPW
jgi:NAD(P)-dependent dehydrogenase (short-subunit alcohol dehydrogenase family)